MLLRRNLCCCRLLRCALARRFLLEKIRTVEALKRWEPLPHSSTFAFIHAVTRLLLAVTKENIPSTQINSLLVRARRLVRSLHLSLCPPLSLRGTG